MNTMITDPVFDGRWNNKSLALAYQHFQIKDERSRCTCGRITMRTFDGMCYTCHVALFKKLERQPCPMLP